MNINDAFPGNYLKAPDLKGKDVPLTIAGVAMAKVGDDNVPVVSFAGTERMLVLNKTNSNTIADTLGPDTDQWIGQKITLYATTCEFQGKTVPCLRVRPAMAVAVHVPAAAPVDESDIPF